MIRYQQKLSLKTFSFSLTVSLQRTDLVVTMMNVRKAHTLTFPVQSTTQPRLEPLHVDLYIMF
jgi:hypothetical protein